MKFNKYSMIVALMMILCVGLILFIININREEKELNISHTINETQKETEFFLQSDHMNTLNSEETESFPEINTEEIEDYPKLIEENQLYKLTCEEDGYYCYFYDFDHNIAQKKGPMMKMPKLKVVDNNYVKLTVQAGTGVSTQWGYYYDINQRCFSDVFYWILAESDNKVAYVIHNKVIIRDIFDKTKYYKEISNFKYSFSDAIEPIISVEFEGSYQIKITYLSGEDYSIITELFDL